MIEFTPRAYLPQLDRLQLVALTGLMVIGVAFIYSATTAGEFNGLLAQYQEHGPAQFVRWMIGQYFFRQVVWYGVGITLAVVACLVDYRILGRWSFVIYWAMILLLVLVLIPGIGSMGGGARRWIELGPFRFQPSEFAKIAFIMALAAQLRRPPGQLQSWKPFLRAAVTMALPFLLIMKEPDLGSALVLAPIGFAMMLAAGMSRRLLFGSLAIASLLASLFLVDILFAPEQWQIQLKDYQKKRLLVYFGIPYAYTPSGSETPAEARARARHDQFNDSHNIRQALISVGSGGLTGKGYRQGTQNSLGYLPPKVAHNDFIFSVIAEESGFVGSVIVLALYGGVLFSGIRIANEACDRFGRLVAVGVVCLFFSQVFINIGMNIRIMPVTGVPLPLLSYGGSSVISSLIAMGLLQNIYIHRKAY